MTDSFHHEGWENFVEAIVGEETREYLMVRGLKGILRDYMLTMKTRVVNIKRAKTMVNRAMKPLTCSDHRR